MSDTRYRHPITLKRVVHAIDGMDAVPIRRDIEYRSDGSGPLTLDLYSPIGTSPEHGHPVVVIVGGYRDAGVPLPLGCTFKEMEMVTSLARLIAASGMVAAMYTTSAPASDILAVLDYLAVNAATFGIDGARIGLYAMSGNVPVALSALISARRPAIRAAVLSQGFTMDIDGSVVADAARTYGFADAASGRSGDDLPSDVPLFIARAGRDEFPGLNPGLDRFVSAAIARNLPVVFVNHHTATHGFEVNDDTAASRQLIDQMLQFLQRHLAHSPGVST